MTQTLTRPTPAGAPPRTARPGVLLALLLTGQFMALLDVSVVNVAAATIRTDLRASGAGLQLVIAGYTIAYAVLLVTGARLGERFGQSRMFLAGLCLFTAASLACGLAGGTGQLVAFRFVQGAGAAVMVPQVLSLIQRTFSGQARAKALGVYAAVISGGAVAGQVIGGALVGADLWHTGWRPAFLVNVPIGLVLLGFGLRLMPGVRTGRPTAVGPAGVAPAGVGHPSAGLVDGPVPAGSAVPSGRRAPDARGIDLPGLITLALTVLLFVVPLVLGHEEHWPAWGWVCLGLSPVVLAVFVLTQRRATAPLLPGRVLRAPGLPSSVGSIFLTMAAYTGFLFAFALHLQSGLGESPLRAGLSFVPMGAAFALASLNWRRLPARWLPAVMPLGLVLAAASLLALAFGLRSGGQPGVAFWVGGAGYGLGMGSAFSPLMNRALSRVPAGDAADASGLVTTLAQLAQVIGVATFGTLFLTVAGQSPSGHAVAITLGVAAGVTGIAAACAALASR